MQRPTATASGVEQGRGMMADIATMYANFDHVNPPIGPDGTPYQHYGAMIDAAQTSGQQVGGATITAGSGWSWDIPNAWM